jgi:hypothetical protein
MKVFLYPTDSSGSTDEVSYQIAPGHIWPQRVRTEAWLSFNFGQKSIIS